MSRLPLTLHAEVVTADGTRYRWDPDQAAGSRPQGLSFSTKLGEGFATGSLRLSRRIDGDYPDLNLVDTVSIVGADGTVAYEGRLAALPRELGDTHSIGVTLAGWMSHAKDRRFSEIYVDRDLGAWGGMSARRRARALENDMMPISDGQRFDSPTDNLANITTAVNGKWVSPYTPLSEAWYDAGPEVRIGRIGFGWRIDADTIVGPFTYWDWRVHVSSDDALTANESTSNQANVLGPRAGELFSPAARYRYAVLQLSYAATASGSDGVIYPIAWTKLAVYGSHTLPLYTGEPGEPEGVLASDVIRDVARRWCPQLDPSGVNDTSYVIAHCAFKDRAFPYDAFLEVNKYHLWNLAVWEDRRLCFEPYDLTDYDWEVRTDAPGVTFSPQGPSTDDLYNGVVVTYVDLLTGIRGVLTPETDPDLRDNDPGNPWTAHGVEHWEEITLSTPTLRAQALELGRAALADRNRPKTPGSITVKGYIRDRAGNEQPAWKVRAGQTIAITDFPNDSPRLIVETSWDDDDKALTMAIDKPFALLDAYLDRVGNALGARGLA